MAIYGSPRAALYQDGWCCPLSPQGPGELGRQSHRDPGPSLLQPLNEKPARDRTTNARAGLKGKHYANCTAETIACKSAHGARCKGGDECLLCLSQPLHTSTATARSYKNRRRTTESAPNWPSSR